MKMTDERWLATVDAFQAAAVDRTGWYPALQSLAQVTGSRVGELICIGGNGYVPLNIMTETEPAMLEAFVECGGGDPAINPRVGVGMKSPVLEVLAECDFISPDEHKRHPHYQEFAVPWGIPFICLSTLDRTPDMLIGLAVGRTQEQGHITPAQREVFASIAPHVRAAVRTQMALENNGAAILAGAMEALSIPAFICDRSGTVRGISPAAEALVRAERGVNLKLDRLCADNPVESQALDEAIAVAARGHEAAGPPVHRSVVLRGKRTDGPPLVLDVIPLSRRQYELGFAPRVLVIARGTRAASERTAAILQAAYALTAAETEIAMQLRAGEQPGTIAQARGVAVGTVRAQIKTIFAKLGVSRQAELVARIGDL